MKLSEIICKTSLALFALSLAEGFCIHKAVVSVEHPKCQYSYGDGRSYRFKCRVLHKQDGSIAFIDNIETGKRYDTGWIQSSRAGCIYKDVTATPAPGICAIGKRYYVQY